MDQKNEVNRQRVWNELRNAIFYVEILNLRIYELKKRNDRIEIALLMISLIGIAGWNRFANLNVVWSILLGLVVLTRIFLKFVRPPNEFLFKLRTLNSFYMNQSYLLEKLWYRIETKRISVNSAHREIENFSDQEKFMNDKLNLDQINFSDEQKRTANWEAKKRLKKFYNE